VADVYVNSVALTALAWDSDSAALATKLRCSYFFLSSSVYHTGNVFPVSAYIHTLFKCVTHSNYPVHSQCNIALSHQSVHHSKISGHFVKKQDTLLISGHFLKFQEFQDSVHACELCKNGWTNRFAVWVVDSSRLKEPQVQSYSPGCANVPSWEGTSTQPGKYNWTIRLLRRCMRPYAKLLWSLVVIIMLNQTTTEAG